jgi:hypothetical protein
MTSRIDPDKAVMWGRVALFGFFMLLMVGALMFNAHQQRVGFIPPYDKLASAIGTLETPIEQKVGRGDIKTFGRFRLNNGQEMALVCTPSLRLECLYGWPADDNAPIGRPMAIKYMVLPNQPLPIVMEARLMDEPDGENLVSYPDSMKRLNAFADAHRFFAG